MAISRAAEMPLPATSPMASASRASYEAEIVVVVARDDAGGAATGQQLQPLDGGNRLRVQLVLDFAGDLQFRSGAAPSPSRRCSSRSRFSVMRLNERLSSASWSLPLHLDAMGEVPAHDAIAFPRIARERPR